MGDRRSGLNVYVHDNVTTVAVQAPDWGRVEAIFSVFEEARTDAVISAEPTGAWTKGQAAVDFPTFRLNARLKSLFVDKSLVEELEHYAAEDIPTIASLEQNRESTFGLAITDLLGTEKFRTVRIYPLTKFPDGTQEIELELSISGMNGEELNVRITFHEDRDFSAIAIRSKLPQAREIAVAVLDGLNHRVRQNRTLVGSLLN